MIYKLIRDEKVLMIGSFPDDLTELDWEFEIMKNLITKVREIRKYPLYKYLIEDLENGIKECENMPETSWGKIGPDILRKDLRDFTRRLNSIDKFLRSLDYMELSKIYDLDDDEILNDPYLIRELIQFELK